MDRIAWYRVERKRGASAKEIAAKWELGSPKALFQLLNTDGFPLCEECGEYSKAGACSKHRRRKPRGTGRADELASAANAVDLLRPAVETLSGAVRSLDHHIEQYRAGRFEKADSYPIGTVTFSRRAFYSEEEWRAFCEMYEGDPDEGSLMIAAQRVINTMGADASPRETPLIAAYFLWDGPQEQSEEQKLEALLEALHRKPAEADRQKLLHGNPNNPRQHPGEIEKLRRAARRVARLVRGVSIDGAPAEGLTAEDFNLARHIREQLQAGNLTKHLSKI